MAETSLSSLASRYAKTTPEMVLALAYKERSREKLAADIRSMAASLLRQDETKGLRGIVKRMLGR